MQDFYGKSKFENWPFFGQICPKMPKTPYFGHLCTFLQKNRFLRFFRKMAKINFQANLSTFKFFWGQKSIFEIFYENSQNQH